MPNPVYRTATFLTQLVHRLPIGTNLSMGHLLFTLLAGNLLHSRGALFPALAAAGLADAQVRAAEAALRTGAWNLAALLGRLSWLVQQEGKAPLHEIGGWRPLLLAWVGFFRPRLLGCTSKHFDGRAGKALPALELGMIARLHGIGRRTLPCLVATTRSGDTLTLLQQAKIQQAKQGAKGVLLADRQVKMGHLHAADIHHFVVRAAVNLTARRSTPPPVLPGKRGRKPTRGRLVRPLARTYRGKALPATAPDRVETFVFQGRALTGHWFDALVLPGCPLVVACLVIVDPRYQSPWVLLTDLAGQSAETIFRLYRCRGHIEQLPQTGKQLLGGQRAFVHAEPCRHRLPEVCLLAASLSLYLSATSPARATGFWDRHPEPTPGRFRRALAGSSMPDLSQLAPSGGRVRQKRSVHGHLPKGVSAHRRQKRPLGTPALTGK
jgi:hypothetical protein